jgi:hypothetical protein
MCGNEKGIPQQTKKRDLRFNCSPEKQQNYLILSLYRVFSDIIKKVKKGACIKL